MPSAPRSGWPWVLVALLAAGGLVLLLSSDPFGRGASESAARRERTSTEGFPAAPRGGPPEPAAEVTVEPAPLRDAPEPGIEPPARLRIRVAAVEGGVPLVGARVEAWEVAQGEPDADLPLPGLTHVAGTTDAEGRVVLDPPVAGGAVRLLASASGYRVGQASFDVTPVGEVTLGLRSGLVIEGWVVDPRGDPVPGIEVRARHSDRPAALSPESGQPAPLVAGAEEASTRSDPEGAFRLDGLTAGYYRVGVFEPGWVLAGPAGASPRGTHFWVSHAPAEAGTTALRLVAVPIRVVRLQPIDAETNEPIRGTPWTLEASVTDPATRASASSYVPPPYGSESGNTPAVLLRFDRVPPPGTEAEATLVAEGYDPAHVRAVLRLPGEDESAQQPVALHLAGPRGQGRLSIRFAVEPDAARVTVCRLEDHVLVRRALQRGPDASWRCGELPAGEAEVHVWNGASAGGPFRVTLEAGVETALTVEMPPPTGVVVVLRDLRGRRVYDADSLVFAAPGETRGMSDRAASTRLFPGERRPLDRLVPLAPGIYRWAASKQGAGFALGTVTVVQGEVARLEVRLDPEGLARARRSSTQPPR